MEIQHLRCFVAVAQELHFGRAAERLHLTPSPVSRNIKDLERDLGVELFSRGYHTVQLTGAGAALVDPVSRILHDVAQLRRTAQSAADIDQRATVLRIGVSHIAHPDILDEVMTEVRRHFPAMEFQVEAGTTFELLPSLQQDVLDLAVVHTPVGPEEEIDSVLAARYSFVVAMRADDELAGRGTLTLDDLIGRTLLTQPLRLQPPEWAQMRRDQEAIGMTDYHEVTTTDPALLARYVRHTRELDMTTSFNNAVYDDPAFALVPIEDPRLRWSAAVAWRRDLAGSDPTIRIIARHLTERFREPLQF